MRRKGLWEICKCHFSLDTNKTHTNRYTYKRSPVRLHYTNAPTRQNTLLGTVHTREALLSV